MVNSESTTRSDSTDGQQSNANIFDQWLGLFSAGTAIQTNLLTALNRTALETGLALQRQNAALAESWMRAVTGVARTPVSSGPDRRVPTDSQRQSERDEQVAPREETQAHMADETIGPSFRQARSQGRPPETTPESSGGQVAATTSRTETEGVDPDTEAEGVDPRTEIDRLDSIGPRAAQQLRAADVHTIEQLARARTKELAAQTGLHPRRVRVWVFRARRIGDW